MDAAELFVMGREQAGNTALPAHTMGWVLPWGVVICGEIPFPSSGILTQKSGLDRRSIRMAFTEPGPAHMLGFISIKNCLVHISVIIGKTTVK